MESSSISTSLDLPFSAELLKYYKDRVELYEKERKELIDKLEQVKIDYKRQHDMEWESRRREEEIQALKKALSDAQMFIFEEREHAMQLQHDNDALRIQELEDRRKIKDLLALTRPLTQEVTFFKDCRPEQMTRHIMVNKSEKNQNVQRTLPTYPEDAIVIEDEVCPTSGTDSEVVSGSKYSSTRKSVQNSNVKNKNSDMKGSRVLRTVFLPNEKTDALVLQVESMKAQFEEQYRLFQEKESTLMQEKKVREEEERLRAERDHSTISRLQSDLQRVENTLTKTTREYFVLSFRSKVEERKQKEQIELLKAENANLMKQIELLKNRTRKEIKLMLNTAREESEEVARHFRQQAIDRDNDVITLQDQLSGYKEKYEAKMRMMEKKLFTFESKYRHLSSRRAVDLEGFNSDVTLLRRHIQKLESRLAKTVALSIPAQSEQEAMLLKEDQQTFAKQLELLKGKLSSVEREVRRTSTS